jgi:hypothetical protein
LNSKKNLGFRSGTNSSAAIHQDGEKPVFFVPYFFRPNHFFGELLGFLLNWQKLGLKAPESSPSPIGFFSSKSR